MIYNIYSIQDALVGFNSPTLQNNDASAMRSFAEVFKDVYSPEDYSLWKIGTFDSEKGMILGDHPILICRATDFVKGDNDNGEK